MIAAEVVTMLVYILSMAFLKTEFDLDFILTGRFVWKTLVITLVSAFPLYVIRVLRRYYAPAIYQKLS
jgi:phospholipid-translocating ATPase